jgi:hypothetical protein
MNKCANNFKTGCQNLISHKGTIFCQDCLDTAKSASKNRRELYFDEFVEKIKKLEDEIKDEKKKNLFYTEKINNLEKNNTSSDDIEIILTENKKLKDIILNLRLENETLLKEREIYIGKFNQLRIDYQKIKLENINLKAENDKN